MAETMTGCPLALWHRETLSKIVWLAVMTNTDGLQFRTKVSLFSLSLRITY